MLQICRTRGARRVMLVRNYYQNSYFSGDTLNAACIHPLLSSCSWPGKVNKSLGSISLMQVHVIITVVTSDTGANKQRIWNCVSPRPGNSLGKLIYPLSSAPECKGRPHI